MQAGDESVHTVNAAAVVLAAAARSSTGLQRNHHQHLQLYDHAPAGTKKRWWSWLTKPNLACFRPHVVGHPRRIANAGDTSPQPATTHTTASAAAYVHHAPPVHPVFAFVVPPSSPASSLFASESPSPVLLLNASTTSSPGMFAVGPYARGPQQLVSPPVLYSAFTTEPSTAPRTPPATTSPSSPEVPFARFLSPSPSSSMAVGEAGLFHAYQLQPGSPIPLGSSSPQLFRKKLHRRNEGSLLDGHIPMAAGGGELDLDVLSGARDEGHGGGVMDQDDDEVPKSGEFVFGNADNGGAAPAEDTDGEDRKSWQFFPMAEQGMI
ncbi:uncharacterized protein [Lolium perenne]|uniref:uncharacterized protein isoform X1 n=1 Tax=Lolium perenne TaxID=4522 RepID=UPI0021EA8EE5|nr:uncharacterized protein At1g76660-like isoform X1 [Lolium perenne]